MHDFQTHYDQLNERQREAVDTIDGPVMVVAGPGTGKTQLLSMRVANILRVTDATAGNILCLTFTESGAAAMRQRLVRLIGQPAYNVAIHTFHSFGSEIINAESDYFYNGARFRPADELSSYEVLRGIFEDMDHSNPLSSTMNDEYVHLRDTQKAISDLKRSGLSADELMKVLDHNDVFISHATPILRMVFDAGRLSKKSFPVIRDALEELAQHSDAPMPVVTYRPLSVLVIHSLQRAIEDAEETGSTKPISAWKREWVEKDADGKTALKEHRRSLKLRALAHVYFVYRQAMQKRGLYDFDDMILNVKDAMTMHTELKLNLQERYQYILVDEFQDTNGAQLLLLHALTDNPVNEGRPNILVVGDDDQAIYRFQGADISNILSFEELYREPAVITLVDNYRSDDSILTAARQVITQADERLEVVRHDIDKTLKAHLQPSGSADVSLDGYTTTADEYHAIARRIREVIRQGTPATDIAVIGRNHVQLQQILPHLLHAGVPLSYERQDDILADDIVAALELLARVVTAIAEQQFDLVNNLLPQLLAHPMWQLDSLDLSRVSLSPYRDRKMWLEMMLDTPGRMKDIAEWLIVSGHDALHQPLELVIDRLLGTDETQVADHPAVDASELDTVAPTEEFTSPMRAYYFSAEAMKGDPGRYTTHLLALTTIRRRLREYRPDTDLRLVDFIRYIDTYRRLGMRIPLDDDFRPAEECVTVMTAHKSKGLEYDVVFIAGATNAVWGSASRGRSSSLSFPHNLPLASGAENDDERLRLLFVAMTRAKSRLYISYATTDSNGKPAELAKFLATDALSHTFHEDSLLSEQDITRSVLTSWHDRYLMLPKTNMRDLLAPRLEKYRLSSTHLTNFLDVTRGGPQAFLLQNLLRFPQVMSPAASFGVAIHTALTHAHNHLRATGKRRPVEDVLHDFEQQLIDCSLAQRDMDFLLQKGGDVLRAYLAQRYDTFSPDQLVARDFARQGIVVGGVPITGEVDLMDIDQTNKVIKLTDFKTGKPAAKWQGSSDPEKMKLHRYRQQLMFYKLLVDHSRDFGGAYNVESGALEFIEPDSSGRIQNLEMLYDEAELDRMRHLMQAVWRRIVGFDFPDTSGYEQSFKGILAFEDDLIAEIE